MERGESNGIHKNEQSRICKGQHSSFFGGFVTFSILYTTQPLLPVFSKEFHISAASASLTVSASTGTLAFMMLVAASLSDVLGKRKS